MTRTGGFMKFMRKTQHLAIVFIVQLAIIPVHARIHVLFHPHGPTLEKIAEIIEQKPQTIEIAMYNMETSPLSPIIKSLQKPEIQLLIRSGSMKIRLLFEGTGKPIENSKKMQDLENLGIDVRSLSSSVKIHHKFAVVNAGLANSIVITGSANWSLGSQKNYDENIMFIEDEPSVANNYSNEFETLWAASEEFGSIQTIAPPPIGKILASDSPVVSHFNSGNFIFQNGTVRINRNAPGFGLTRLLVSAIDNAQKTIDIATTRIKLRPIYEALLRASARGVKIRTLVSMDEYNRIHYRLKVPTCLDIFNPDCSTGESYSLFLDRMDFIGHENIDLRIKFYNLNSRQFITAQMHHKYVIIDEKKVFSGSFNWSLSSEYDHLENILEIQGIENQSTIQQFSDNFEHLWELNRDHYQRTLDEIKNSSSPKCAFTPMSLSLKQIDLLLYSAKGKDCI